MTEENFMYKEVRNREGRSLFKWDAENNAVEILIKGKKEIIFLKPNNHSPPPEPSGNAQSS